MTEKDSRKTILIVDDDRSIHELLKALFEGAGYRTLSALDAMQAMLMAKQNNPDLVVLDIMMPAGGGFAVYERFKMLTTLNQVPIMVFSSTPRPLILEKIQEGPKLKVFSKTTPITELLSAAETLIA